MLSEPEICEKNPFHYRITLGPFVLRMCFIINILLIYTLQLYCIDSLYCYIHTIVNVATSTFSPPLTPHLVTALNCPNSICTIMTNHRNSSSNVLIKLTDICKSYANKTIFDTISLTINYHDRIVIVGENGIGKSTLFHIILNTTQYDSGTLYVNPDCTIGYLRQDLYNVADQSVLQYLISISHNKQLQSIYDTYNNRNQLDSDEFNDEFIGNGGYEYFKLMDELNLSSISLLQKIDRLSGGQKTKLTLIGLCIAAPDIILLDEPTNHLDIHTLQWLDQYVASTTSACVIITHDRTLINNSSTDTIYELTPDTHQLIQFHGRYHDYLRNKNIQYQREKQAKQVLERDISDLKSKLSGVVSQSLRPWKLRDTADKLSYNYKSQNKQKSYNAAKNQITSKLTSLSESLHELPQPSHPIDISFNTATTSNQFIDEYPIVMQNVSYRYPDTQHYVLHNISLRVHSHDRVLIIGTNGCGKSTLLKLITGELSAIDSVHTTINIQYKHIGYLDQEQQSLMIHSDLTPIQYCMLNQPSSMKRDTVFGTLKKFGIYDTLDMRQPVKYLSVGKQRKVQLARIVLNKSSILLLDEPTNHIDLMSVEQIETQLAEFNGPIIAVTHDRMFIQKFNPTQIINLDYHKQAELG